MRPPFSKDIRSKDLIIFDLDGTLAPTKSQMDDEMSDLLTQLLRVKKVAVIGGGKYETFQTQLLDSLQCSKEELTNLSLFPATSTSYYAYESGWTQVYSHVIPPEVRERIKQELENVFKEIGYKHPDQVYGEIIEDRQTQVTFSALGQDVVRILGTEKGVALKDKWRKENTEIKMAIAREMAKRLPDLEVHAAGHTSVDITQKGIDKGYGVRQIEKYLHIPVEKMIFIGDALFEGGNDYAALKTGIDYIPVKDPEDTKEIIRRAIA